MSRPLTLALPLALLALCGWFALAPADAQDSRPKTPTPGQKEGGQKKGDEKKEDGKGEAKSPLEDPEWQKKAKLGKSLAKKRCVICHKIDGKGGMLSPPMEEVTAKRFVANDEYAKYVANLKRTDPARYRASKETIDKIAAEEDRYQRLVLWLEQYLVKPTFDNGKAKMTPQSLKKEELEQVIAFVLSLEPKKDEKKD